LAGELVFSQHLLFDLHSFFSERRHFPLSSFVAASFCLFRIPTSCSCPPSFSPLRPVVSPHTLFFLLDDTLFEKGKNRLLSSNFPFSFLSPPKRRFHQRYKLPQTFSSDDCRYIPMHYSFLSPLLHVPPPPSSARGPPHWHNRSPKRLAQS